MAEFGEMPQCWGRVIGILYTPNISLLMEKTLRREWFDKIQIIELGIHISSIYHVLVWAFQFASLIDSYTKKQISIIAIVCFHSVVLRIFSFLLITSKPLIITSSWNIILPLASLLFLLTVFMQPKKKLDLSDLIPVFFFQSINVS